MSLPPDLLDQLLSGYLDDSLSRDERARVEALLADDPSVAAELDELRGLRASLQLLAQAESQVRLPDGFAERVVAAAIRQAEREGVDEDHPLLRIGASAAASDPRRAMGRPRHYAAGLLALAASIGIAVMALRPEAIRGPKGNPGLAAVDVESETAPATAIEAAGPTLPQRADLATSRRAAEEVDRSAETNRPADSDPSNPSPPPERIAATDGVAAAPADPKQIEAMRTAPPSPETPSPDTNAASSGMQIGAILVLDVRLTERGRSERAIELAMAEAELDAESEKELSAELVGHLRRGPAADTSDREITLLYLQAGAKKLDRFYLNLLSDPQAVESVGMTLAVDAPILKIVQSIAVDPTTVQHREQSFRLTGERATDHLVGELSRLPYVPFDRRAVATPSSSGPDVPAQILVLVR